MSDSFFSVHCVIFSAVAGRNAQVDSNKVELKDILISPKNLFNDKEMRYHHYHWIYSEA